MQHWLDHFVSTVEGSAADHGRADSVGSVRQQILVALHGLVRGHIGVQMLQVQWLVLVAHFALVELHLRWRLYLFGEARSVRLFEFIDFFDTSLVLSALIQSQRLLVHGA